MIILSARGVAFNSGQSQILHDVSFDVKQGDIVTILGPSGSGKSTLLKIMADLISPSRGELLYNNKPVNDYAPTTYRKLVRYVPQSTELFAKTVKESMAFVYQIRKQPVDEVEIRRTLGEFNMSNDYLEKDTNKLSGGERQRIALARSLLFKPEVLLLDEPTSALDADNGQITENILKQFSQSGGTILWVTHNENQSQRLSSQVLRLKKGQMMHANKVKSGK